jgi:hypothetical protein
MDYRALRAEILASFPGVTDDAAIAASLNAVSQAIRIDRQSVPAQDVFECIVPGEWSGLSANEKDRMHRDRRGRGASRRAVCQGRGRAPVGFDAASQECRSCLGKGFIVAVHVAERMARV